MRDEDPSTAAANELLAAAEEEDMSIISNVKHDMRFCE